VPDHEFVFALHLSERGGFDEMLGDLASSVLRHAGYPETDIAGLGDEMRAGVAKAGMAGAEYDVEFLAHAGELRIVVSCDGRRVFSTSRPLP